MNEGRAEMDLSLYQEGVEAALQVARAGVWELHMSDLTSKYSDGYYQLMGMSPEEGRKEAGFWRKRAHPDDMERVQQRFEEYAARPAGLFEEEYRLRHADGRWVWVFVRGRAVELDEDGSCRRAVGFIVDVSERRALYDSLRRSEERYRLAVNAIRGMVYEVDLSTDHLVQHGVEDLLGYNPASDSSALEIWLHFIHAEDRDEVYRVVREHRRTGAPYELTYRVKHADGRMLRVWHRGTYLMDEAGVPYRAFGVIEDVTADWKLREELRETERQLRESQQVLHTVAAISPVHLTLFDRDLRCVFANRSVSGGDASEILGRRIEDILPGPHGAAAARLFAEVLTDGSGRDFVDHMDLPGVGLRHIHVLLRPVQREGEVIGLVANVTDITDARHQQAQQRLQASIIERMREGVMLMDRNAQILFTNPALDAMFDCSPGELAGRNAAVLHLHQAKGFDDLPQLVRASAESDRTIVSDLEGPPRAGVLHTYQCLISGAKFGDESCVIAVISDISEHKRLQRELLQLEARVQHQIGSDLHDGVGQQLAGIAMMLKSLVRRIGVRDAREVRADVQHIIDLVNQALQSTRSLARGLAPVRTDREGLYEGFEELAQHVFERYHVRVQLDLELPEEAEGIDENCASNIYRIAQEGVLNAARHGRATHIALLLRVGGGVAELVVSDDGRGFDPQKVGRGGMGLRVMRFRAQMLGGYLSVESVPGGGTTLRCRCPLSPEREVA